MQVPQVRTVITTGQSLKNTYNQLKALEQEKRVWQYEEDRTHFSTKGAWDQRKLNQIAVKIGALNRQINQIHVQQSIGDQDTLTISSTAINQYRFHSE
ncbi:hypothetical protein NBRC111894_1557 [Sporolactobacillus inulinus]|jgi:hypothetical protein|uniref:Uncharacterized protein n=1 Tax=Sporolactobacillus inulinus TaxID=2078 RepID=A0A4Y1ZAQ1_9BACL|nr:hypothetical protein [Sporolactobacillus inulinus]GAY76003.1 hypothetical protein NBRC111894_1557 [Sporolactobacillus inulinus]